MKLQLIINYCDYQLKHCQDMIRLFEKDKKRIKYLGLREEMRDMKNIYIGRLQAVKKVCELLEGL